jgi:hypothetical protein
MFQTSFATPQIGFAVKRFAVDDGDKTSQFHARRAPAAISRHDCRHWPPVRLVEMRRRDGPSDI